MQEVLYVKNNEGDVKAGDCSKNSNEEDVKLETVQRTTMKGM